MQHSISLILKKYDFQSSRWELYSSGKCFATQESLALFFYPAHLPSLNKL